MPVGQHIANTPVLDNGYRVLGSDGKPRPDFRWDSPEDLRDPVEVLREDGVRFDVAVPPTSRNALPPQSCPLSLGFLTRTQQAKTTTRLPGWWESRGGIGIATLLNLASQMIGSNSAVYWSTCSARQSRRKTWPGSWHFARGTSPFSEAAATTR